MQKILRFLELSTRLTNSHGEMDDFCTDDACTTRTCFSQGRVVVAHRQKMRVECGPKILCTKWTSRSGNKNTSWEWSFILSPLLLLNVLDAPTTLYWEVRMHPESWMCYVSYRWTYRPTLYHLVHHCYPYSCILSLRSLLNYSTWTTWVSVCDGAADDWNRNILRSSI